MHAARPGRKCSPRGKNSVFSPRKGKQKGGTEKKHYKLYGSPLSVPTIAATVAVVHVVAKTVNYGPSCSAFRMKQRK